MYKCELARAAGVSLTTLRQWCQENYSELCDYGYHPNDKLLSQRLKDFPFSIESWCKDTNNFFYLQAIH